MKHSSRRYLIRSCLCVVLLPLALSRVSSQTPRRALLDLRSCGRTLTVFDDRTLVVESYLVADAGKKTERQLSEKQMRKLRKVIASDPCEQQQQAARRHKNPSPKASPETMTLLSSDNNCFGVYLGDPRDLLEVVVTRHYPGHDQSMVVYLPCGRDAVRPQYQKYIHPKWKRYLYDVVDALGGESILEACHCGKSNNPPDNNKPAVYIAFVRVEKGSVLLRIKNNSQWTIMVPTESGCISSTPPCSLDLVEISDGSRVVMKYQVEGDTGKYHFFGNAFTRLPAGSSVLFLVPQSGLRERDIYVPFLYEWDKRPEMFDEAYRLMHSDGPLDPNLEHRVYFRSYDLGDALKKTN